MSSNAELALRAIQKADQLLPCVTGHAIRGRTYLTEALSALGDELGLECTGADEGDGNFDHSGDTCPIHEWFDENDYAEVSEA